MKEGRRRESEGKGEEQILKLNGRFTLRALASLLVLLLRSRRVSTQDQLHCLCHSFFF